MYEVGLSEEARVAAGELPHDALKALAELIDLLMLQPESGRLYRGPGSDLRTVALVDGQLLVIWLVLRTRQQVEILRLIWLGDEAL